MTLELKSGEHRQRPTAGSAFAVLMSSPARGGFSVGQLPPKKGANIADGQLRGDWRLFNALVDAIALRSCLESGSAVFTRLSTELSTIQSLMQLSGCTLW